MANTHGRGTNSVIRIRLQEIRNRLSSIITGISGLEASLTTTVETATTSDITGLTGTTSATTLYSAFIDTESLKVKSTSFVFLIFSKSV